MNQLVDDYGRVIPVESERVFSRNDRRYFVLQQQDFENVQVYERLRRFFEPETFEETTNEDFQSELKALRTSITSNPSTQNLFLGPHIPFLLPAKFRIPQNLPKIDYLVQKAGESFSEEYPKFEFKFLSEPNLDSICGETPNSGWEKLAQQWQKKNVIGWYFPRALAGFAIPNQASAIKRFPQNFVLSGIPEVAAAFVGMPKILNKSDGKYPNLLALTGLRPTSKNQEGFFWFFEAYGWNLYFNIRSSVGAVSEYFSGGLTVIAE